MPRAGRLPNEIAADPLVSSLLATSRRRPTDEPHGPHPPPAWRETAAAAPPRSLPALCEPLFLWICRLSRASRLPAQPQLEAGRSAQRLRAEAMRLLEIAAVAADSTGQRDSFNRVRRPLELFVDDRLSRRFTSPDEPWLPVADEGPSFYALLDVALVETDSLVADRLTVFYTCLGLGFGSGADDDRRVQSYLARLSARLGGRIDSDESSPICPDAYRHTDRRPLSEPVGGKLVFILLAAALLIIAVLAFDAALYFVRTGSLPRDLASFGHTSTPMVSVPASTGQGGKP